MNAQITQARGRDARPARRADRRDDVLADVGDREPRRPAGQPDPARRAVHDQARQDLRRGRHACSRRTGRRRSPARRSTSAATRRAGCSRSSSATRRSRAPAPGLERSLNDYLTGSNTNLNTVAADDARPAQGRDDQGQRRAPDREPAGRSGSRCSSSARAAARSSRSTRAPARCSTLASTPTYNPNAIERNYGQISRIRADCTPAAPLLNRATDGLFTPGSTFKVVTASAALDSGRFTPESPFYDPGYCVEYGKHVRTRATRTRRSRRSGTSTLFQGARALDQLGLLQHRDQARRGPDPRLGEEVRLLQAPAARDAGERAHGERPLQERPPVRPAEPGDAGRPRPARLRPGADARDAAADGDGRADGRERRRRDAARTRSTKITAPGGTTVTRTQPHSLGRAISGEHRRRDHVDDGRQAVQSGTGTSAQIPGVQVAGKTGTAETGVNGVNTTVVHLLRARRPPDRTRSRSSSRSSTATAAASRRRSRRPFCRHS